MMLVSACLAGFECRYDGKSKPCQKLIDLVKQGKMMPVCPEIMGGLPTPRDPVEIKGNRAITIDGKDVTESYIKGAKEGLKLAQLIKAKKAVLKARSPSCGSGQIYDGTFSKKLINGDGFFAQLLKKNKIEVISEEEIIAN